VSFREEYTVPGSGLEYGYIFVGKDIEGDNITQQLVAEGLVEVRRMGIRANDEMGQCLIQSEDLAKAGGKGRWGANASQYVRNVTWDIDNPRYFVDSHHQKPLKAIIEHVRDGCTVRAFILPSFHHVTIMMSGIKCPMFKIENDETVAENFADQARYYTESRLLQREVQVILEGVSNQFILGTIIHPKGNIQEMLVKEGFARCVDWSMGVVTQGAENLRAAEKEAKALKLRMWQNYTPSTVNLEIQDKNFTAKVIEVVNGDSLTVKMNNGDYKKIFLSSVRPPRPVADGEELRREQKMRNRPLYDTPYMFEAREFLRKKLVGRKVNVTVDYVQPPNQGFPEKICCTVVIAGIDVGEAIISKGLGTAIRYRQDDDQRSSHYDELLTAEERAKKKGVGLHCKKDKPNLRVTDISGDVAKAKQFLPFLQRAGRMEGIVEFVASGSRIRLYIPRETCLITFLLSGIDCPRGKRVIGGAEVAADPFGEEAAIFSKEALLQREVEVEVEMMDKGGNFIGWLFVEGVNHSISLVSEGLAKVHFTAERSSYFKALTVAEEKAKSDNKGLWSVYEEPADLILENEPEERSIAYLNIIVTEVTDDGNLYCQHIESGPQLEKLMEQMRSELKSNPPLLGAYTPKKGELCAAKFTDDEWYRARIDRVEKNQFTLTYIDYGNKDVVPLISLGSLPQIYHSLPAQAKLYTLACVKFPTDEDAIADAVETLEKDILNRQIMINFEYKVGNQQYITAAFPDTKEDVAQTLISEGYLLVEKRPEKRLQKLVTSYMKSQEKAKASRMNIWCYGDITEDDAKEFG
jgi:staphylococcal nuclease domain-containing protein 1